MRKVPAKIIRCHRIEAGEEAGTLEEEDYIPSGFQVSLDYDKDYSEEDLRLALDHVQEHDIVYVKDCGPPSDISASDEEEQEEKEEDEDEGVDWDETQEVQASSATEVRMEQMRVEKRKAGVDDGGRQRKKNCRSIKEQARLVAKHREKDTRRRAMKTAKAASGATI